MFQIQHKIHQAITLQLLRKFVIFILFSNDTVDK